MRKTFAGIACVMLAVVIAVISVACSGKGGELTYTGDYPSQSTENVSQTEPYIPDNTSTSEEQAETVLYQLTTQQGETVQVLSTTMPITEIPTMNYDPVTVPTMQTTVIPTTQYVAPTYSYSDPNQVTTKAPTTTEGTTEVKIKYVDVSGGNNDGAISGNKIIAYVENVFGDKITAKSGAVSIDYGSETYKSDAKVSSSLYAGNQVQIEIGIPSSLKNAIETGSTPFAYVTIPRGLIVGSDNVSNKQLRVTICV